MTNKQARTAVWLIFWATFLPLLVFMLWLMDI